MSDPKPTITERVAAGAAWLDEHEPGWVERIDLDSLVMWSTCYCVLGQLYGNFHKSPLLRGVRTDAGKRRKAAALGFMASSSYPYEFPSDGEYEPLHDEWRRLIRERREAAAA